MMNKYSFGSNPDLTCVLKCAHRNPFNNSRYVNIGEDDAWVIATKLDSVR